MDEFITWDMLLVYSTFVYFVYTAVEFLKERPRFKKHKTQDVTFMVAMFLLISTKIAVPIIQYAQRSAVTFDGVLSLAGSILFDVIINLIPAALTAMLISLTANGLSNYNKGKNVSRETQNDENVS
jgi:hypothetical protein